MLNDIGSPNSLQGSEAYIAANYLAGDYVEVPCPSHDNPILMIPRESRRLFFDDLFENDEFKWKLFTNKEFEWVFNDTPCTICSSIFNYFPAY